jgi:CheY-like chemotaxis protein
VAVGHPGGNYSDGLLWSLYMLGTATVSAIIGLIFAVPRARTEYSAEASERYSANSNLEQISDWLTKILVGAGLVELGNGPRLVKAAGDYLGQGLEVQNPGAFAASALIYGTGVGFIVAYLWTRLRFRLLLEASDRDAAEASRRAEELVERLQQAGTAPGSPTESPRALRRAADSALASATTSTPSSRAAILWVDDYPSNNTAIVEAFTSLGIRVDLALSTEEALRKCTERDYGLVISDLGRREAGAEDDMAGLHLIQELSERRIDVPVIVFAGSRGMTHQAELMAAGATLVTNRASQLFERAVSIVTGP